MSVLFPRFCGDGHQVIGHYELDEEDERCPLCLVRADLDAANTEIAALKAEIRTLQLQEH